MLTSISGTSRYWYGLTVSPNDTVYLCSDGGYADDDIFMILAGGTSLIDLNQGYRHWRGICAVANGNVYACVDSGHIYMQTNGTGNFAELPVTHRHWTDLAGDASGNVYASVDGGDIYFQTGGTGDFVALGQTSRGWSGLTVAYNGDVYATTTNGDIYVRTSGIGNFVALNQTSRVWSDIAAAPNGDIYACVYNGGIYKQTNGTGDFVLTDQPSNYWREIAFSSSGDFYAVPANGTVYFESATQTYYNILNIPIIGFKIETTPFTAENLTSADYKYSVNSDIKISIDIESYNQEIASGDFSNFPSISGKKACTIDFSIDLYSKSVLTTAPTYYDILQACGWKQLDTAGGLMIFPDTTCNRVPATIEVSFPEEGTTPRQLVYKISGAMGSVKILGTTGNTIKAEFSFLGKLIGITYRSYANMIVPTGFDSEKPNALISCTFKLFDTEAYLDSFTINSNEIVNLFSNINDASGYDGARISDRYTYGDFTIFNGTDLSSDMLDYITFE